MKFKSLIRKIIIFNVLALTLILTACKNTEIKDNEIGNDEEIEIIKVNKLEDVMLDLDGDKKEEKVSYKVENYLNSDERYSSIIINDVEYRNQNFNPVDSLYITKLKNNDEGYVLLAGDEGASSDYTTQFFKYEKGKLIDLGKIGGIYDENLFGINIVINGDGTVKTKERADILQTWFYDAIYELKDEKLELVKQDFYDVDHQDITLIEYEFYKEPSKDKERVKINKGTEVRFVGTDNEKWIKLEYKNVYGEDSIAYFMVEDFFYIDKENNIKATDLFQNLVFAD